MSAANSLQPTLSRNPMDRDEADPDGNTIFHRAVLGNENLDDVVARAAELHVSADQPNKAGRTPLHVLASHGWYDDVFSLGSGYVAERVRDVLRHAHFRNVDAADARGLYTWPPCFPRFVGPRTPEQCCQLVRNATVAEIASAYERDEGDEGDEDADIAGDVEGIVNNNGQVRTDQDTTQLRPILQQIYEAHERDYAAGPQSFSEHLRAVSRKLAASPSSEPDAFLKYTSQCLCDFERELEREADGQQHGDDMGNDNDLSAVEERECGPDFKNLGPVFGGGDRIVGRLIRKRQFDQIPRLLLRWATPGLFLQENNLRDIKRGNCTEDLLPKLQL
ncbi:hypothetical protein SPBR_08973 [Sporothrix brasiliensis 5110]|uniref:Uncharacterized protein n=1 Tax=Sporothrix brasiliensis 5110 TaxID=1398154 RepID=A0A0C2IUS6_9PEZI|nr:uncharacterized protein SPBR_08973 [Sporothrix brasiliensis 5110]KIH88737.1 hypothetical protein SPBR_08973 [Sporothrix brasiliensis 5110]